MPIAHISLRAGKPQAYRQAIFDGIYRSMRETLNVPEDDQFMTITEHDPANFRYGNAYGVTRSADVVYIQIIVFNTRSPRQKNGLYGWLVELLGECPGVFSKPQKRIGRSATASRSSLEAMRPYLKPS